MEGKIRDYYIPCALTDTDQGLNPPSPVYYVSLKVKNGAGNLSAPTVSTPVIVVPEDVTGIIDFCYLQERECSRLSRIFFLFLCTVDFC